jgi:hypothetical protein
MTHTVNKAPSLLSHVQCKSSSIPDVVEVVWGATQDCCGERVPCQTVIGQSSGGQEGDAHGLSGEWVAWFPWWGRQEEEEEGIKSSAPSASRYEDSRDPWGRERGRISESTCNCKQHPMHAAAACGIATMMNRQSSSACGRESVRMDAHAVIQVQNRHCWRDEPWRWTMMGFAYRSRVKVKWRSIGCLSLHHHMGPGRKVIQRSGTNRKARTCMHFASFQFQMSLRLQHPGPVRHVWRHARPAPLLRYVPAATSVDGQAAAGTWTPTRLISHYFSLRTNQPPVTSRNPPAVLFSQNKPAPAISHQPTEQAEGWSRQ